MVDAIVELGRTKRIVGIRTSLVRQSLLAQNGSKLRYATRQMTAVTTNVIASVGLALLFVFAFRLVFPLDPDPAKKVIRCGLATIVVFQLLAKSV